MMDWLDNLSDPWVALLAFALTYAAAWLIYRVVVALARREGMARAMKGVSPGMLPPMGIIFGLLVVFIAAQVWGDNDRARAAVNREASALRAVVLLAADFPGETETRLRELVRRHINDAVTQEWPAMARRRATLSPSSPPLAEAIKVCLALKPRDDDGQVAAQREILTALENALDARRQRVIVSQTSVNWVKWSGLFVQAALTLLAIAMVHCDNRPAAGIALGLFATGIAVSIVLIASHNRPFSGQISVRPDVLIQVMPEAGESGDGQEGRAGSQ